MLQTMYSKLTLSQKIIIPFLWVFLGMATMGTLGFGYWFSSSLEETHRQEVEELSSLVLRDFLKEEKNLLLQAKLVLDNDIIRQAVERRDTAVLLLSLLPTKATLELDLIKVVDTRGATLVDLRSLALNGTTLRDEVVIEQALSGMYLSDLVPAEGQVQSVLVGFIPVRSQKGLLGGLVIGTAIADELLQKIGTPIDKHLVAFNNGRAIASTLPDARNVPWQPPSTQAPPMRVKIKDRTYIAKSMALSGLNNTALTLVLLHPVTSLDEAKQAIWMKLGSFFCLAAALVTIVGVLVARAIARPIATLTRVTQQLASGDLTARVSVTSGDETGQLAGSFNLMAEQLAARDRLLGIQLQQLQQALQDLKTTQSQLIQVEKMSSLGQLVAGVAHEINNPVNFIHGNLNHADEYAHSLLDLVNLYQQYYPNPPAQIQDKIEAIDFNFILNDLPKILGSMKMGTERIRQIVLSLRNFSRLDESEMKCVDLHQGIDSTLLILNSRLNSGIEVIKQYGNLPVVECYPAQLNQVFMNIISNAIDALLSTEDRPHKQIVIQTETIASEKIRVSIRDNGIGIPLEIQDKLFDPFFTTKPVGKGTGLGLSISYQIIEKHQGQIEVISQLGEGTEFAIALPIKQMRSSGFFPSVATKAIEMSAAL